MNHKMYHAKLKHHACTPGNIKQFELLCLFIRTSILNILKYNK